MLCSTCCHFVHMQFTLFYCRFLSWGDVWVKRNARTSKCTRGHSVHWIHACTFTRVFECTMCMFMYNTCSYTLVFSSSTVRRSSAINIKGVVSTDCSVRLAVCTRPHSPLQHPARPLRCNSAPATMPSLSLLGTFEVRLVSPFICPSLPPFHAPYINVLYNVKHNIHVHVHVYMCVPQFRNQS